MEINGKILVTNQKGGNIMLKKTFGIVAVAALIFCGVAQANSDKNMTETDSYVCCAHNGDMWSN